MQIKKLKQGVESPVKSIDDAGFDIRVNVDFITGAWVLQPRETKTFGTGLAIYLANPALVGFILPRSKLGSKHGIVISNGTGVLDSSYQGELMVSLFNQSNEPFTIEDGMAVAQLVIVKIPIWTQFVEVEEFSEVTKRGVNGINCTELRI